MFTFSLKRSLKNGIDTKCKLSDVLTFIKIKKVFIFGIFCCSLLVGTDFIMIKTTKKLSRGIIDHLKMTQRPFTKLIRSVFWKLILRWRLLFLWCRLLKNAKHFLIRNCFHYTNFLERTPTCVWSRLFHDRTLTFGYKNSHQKQSLGATWKGLRKSELEFDITGMSSYSLMKYDVVLTK